MAKKRIILVLIISLVGSLVFGTGMPVIDISAITQAITSALQEAQRWEQQIKQWQNEYDKAKKAVEGISQGNFTSVVSGIASLSGQLVSINEELGWIDNARFNEFNQGLSDGSYSLLDLASNTQLLINNFDTISDILEENLAKTASASDAYDSATGVLDGMGTATFNSLYNLLRNGGNMVISGAEMVNSVSDMFNLNPEQLVEIYDNQMKQSMEKVGVSNYEGLMSKIDEETKTATDIMNEISKLTSEDTTKVAQLNAKLEEQKAILEKLKTVKEKYEDYQEVIADIKSKEGAWKATEQQNVEQKQEAEKQMARARAELAATEAAYKKSINATKGVAEWWNYTTDIDSAINTAQEWVSDTESEISALNNKNNSTTYKKGK